MNIIKLALARILISPLYFLSWVIPRNRNIWVFGSYAGGFNDNSKYFFIYVNENSKELGLQPVWISSDRKTVDEIRAKGFEAFTKWSFQGVMLSLLSGVYIYSAYVSDINTWTSGRALKVNLWHGIPLKKIEFDITSGVLEPIFNGTLKSKIRFISHYIKPDFFLSVSETTSKVFSSAFRVPVSSCLPFGYPRNSILKLPNNKVKSFIQQYEPEYTKKLINKIETYNKVYVYMPTWRDSGYDFLSAALPDLDKLNQVLMNENSILIIKAHANTLLDVTDDFLGNVIFFKNSADIYPVLSLADCLITDYSSVFFDFMLSEKPIIFYPFDEEEYLRGREMYFSYSDLLVGQAIVKDFDDLLASVGEITKEVKLSPKIHELIDCEIDCANYELLQYILRVTKNT